MIGYTRYQTAQPSRWANQITMRAHLLDMGKNADRELAASLVDEPYSWTQFAGWSPDGETAIINRGWESPENGAWEEANQQFRFIEGHWLNDQYLVDMKTGNMLNVTGVERVSFYNGGTWYTPEGNKLGFVALINGAMTPYEMDLDGRNKTDISGGSGGFIYGYHYSPDGELVAYHDNYQVYIANRDGSNPMWINTGNPFNFNPVWSPDGQHVLFSSGENGRSNPYVVRRDGTELRQLADQNGYRGGVELFDTFDHHYGSSDTPVWSPDGWVCYTAKFGEGSEFEPGAQSELMRVSLDGEVVRLTDTSGSVHPALNYHPTFSPDGQWICFGSNRDGARVLYIMKPDGSSQRRITQANPGWGAMWAHWRLDGSSQESPVTTLYRKELAEEKSNDNTQEKWLYSD